MVRSVFVRDHIRWTCDRVCVCVSEQRDHAYFLTSLRLRHGALTHLIQDDRPGGVVRPGHVAPPLSGNCCTPNKPPGCTPNVSTNRHQRLAIIFRTEEQRVQLLHKRSFVFLLHLIFLFFFWDAWEHCTECGSDCLFLIPGPYSKYFS